MSTEAYPGVLSTSLDYLRDSIKSLLKFSILMALICSITLAGFLYDQSLISVYTIFAFGGLVLYLSQLSLDELAKNEQPDSEIVTFLLAVLAILYYNTVLFLSVLFGLALSYSGHPTIAIVVAGLYPIYDAEMAEMGWPVSVAGVIVVTVGILGLIVEILEERTELYYHYDLVARISQLRRWTTAIQDTLTGIVDKEIGSGRGERPI